MTPRSSNLDGALRQQVAERLWSAWQTDQRVAAVITGFSGIGKSERLVRPLVEKAKALGRPAVHIELPRTPTDFDAEMIGLLAEELEGGQSPLATVVRSQSNLVGALRTILQAGGLVVLDEFQRMLAPGSSMPPDALAEKLSRLARRTGDHGCLWLVTNRELDAGWLEPFAAFQLEAPVEIQDAGRIVVEATGAGEADERFPAARRTEVVRRLGFNPRALHLLGTLLRTHGLEDLLGDAQDVPATPLDPALVEQLEKRLLDRAREGLDAGTLRLLCDLCVLQEPATLLLVQAMSGQPTEVRTQEAKLRDRYLLEVRSGRYQVHPVVREVEGPRLRSDTKAWQAAHRRAGRWFAEPLLKSGGSSIGDSWLALRLAGARYHLTEGGETVLLQRTIASVGEYVEKRFSWSAPALLSDADRDARISLLEMYLMVPGSPGVEFQLAKALWERDGPGDANRAWPHAELATRGQDLSDPWVLWIKLTWICKGPKDGIDAARLATRRVAPNKNLFLPYQILGAYLNFAGRTKESVGILLKGAGVSIGNNVRLLEEAALFAAATSSELLAQVRSFASADIAHFAPLCSLVDILTLEQQGRWGEAAIAARDSRYRHLKHLRLALHEALAWLGAMEPHKAQEVIERTEITGLHKRHANTWLSALIALHSGDLPAASRQFAIYLGASAPTTYDALRAALLYEWDHRFGTFGEANPSLEFPILPPSVSGLSVNVIRPQYGPPVLPQHQPVPEQPVLPTPPADPTMKVLAVATEWNSGHGGLSTLNRQLCLALAAAGVRVVCLVVDHTPEEFQLAADAKIHLVRATSSTGVHGHARLMLRPSLPDGFQPDVIIGHGRVTGPAAKVLGDSHFPRARRLHFLHMAPDEIEWLKEDRDTEAVVRAEQRTTEEVDLGRTSSLVVAVGPRLYNRYLTEFSPDGVVPTRFDPGFDAGDLPVRPPPPGAPWRILVLGRLEDVSIKGIDLAARAMGLVRGRRSDTATPLELVVRGAAPKSSNDLRIRLQGWARTRQLDVVVRPYSTDGDRLEADLQRASLVLMPSRSEGFGLVGLEAIVAGTPVLVSGNSGLGELLREVLDADRASRFVVRMSGDDAQDAETWATAIHAMLSNREASFRDVDDLRRHLSSIKAWRTAVDRLLGEIADAPTPHL